jgi:hypothetical protein
MSDKCIHPEAQVHAHTIKKKSRKSSERHQNEAAMPEYARKKLKENVIPTKRLPTHTQK